VLASLIEHRARPRHVGVAVAVYAPLAVLMFVLPGLVTRVTTACGQPPFDVRGFWDAADAKRTLDACGNTGRAAYLQLQVADLVYPAALGWLLLVTSALLLRRFGGGAWPLLLPIVAMTALDYLENAGVWWLLLRWPDMTSSVADVAGVVTAVKRVFGFIAFSTPLVLVVTEVAFRVRSRMGEPQRRGGPDHPQESP
jgi:hypothetical protein